MKIKNKPENLIEWIALKANLAPIPLIDTQVAFNTARTIMAAAELDIYEAIGKNSKTADEIASICKTHPGATKHLLNALVGIGYLQWNNGSYSLKQKFHKWLLKESESNLIGKLRFQLLEWDWMAKLEDYVRTGKTLEMHSSVSPREWELYQEGMRDLSVNVAREVACKFPLSKDATAILDIGGSHGLFSIELCKKYPTLSSTIMELPGAVEAASAIAKRYDTTNRVHYVAGNALNDDLGIEKYDLIMINNVVHHFTNEQNFALAKKIAAALKPNGIYAIGEFLRQSKPGEGGVVAATTGLYFSLTSSSGTWSLPEIEAWQKAAGLKTEKSIAPMSLPGWKVFIARK
jgi:2-polyprenyl-3-methyl-5-hydroxy-6-metoxy-1,4-benzoquinol methylase